MIKTNEQFVAAGQAAIDSLLTCANVSLANTERLAALNLHTARAFFADSAAAVGTLMSAKNPQELFALQSTLAKPAAEKTVAYSRSVYEILNDSANALSQIVEGQTADLKKGISVAFEESLKNAPAGSEAVVAAVKSALAQADSAYETLSQSSRQAKTLIENTLASANAAAIQLMAKAA
jgi:phasin family protein